MSVSHPVSEAFFSQKRLIRAIRRLWVREVVQSHFLGVNQTVGNSISVGIRTFNIVEG